MTCTAGTVRRARPQGTSGRTRARPRRERRWAAWTMPSFRAARSPASDGQRHSGSRAAAARRAVADGRVVKLDARASTCVADVESTPLVRARAARASSIGDSSVVCDRSAAWLWGVDCFGCAELDGTPALESCVLRGHQATERDEVAGVTRDLRPADWVELGGVRVTTPLRTAADLGCRLWAPHAARGHGCPRARPRVRPAGPPQAVAALPGPPRSDPAPRPRRGAWIPGRSRNRSRGCGGSSSRRAYPAPSRRSGSRSRVVRSASTWRTRGHGSWSSTTVRSSITGPRNSGGTTSSAARRCGVRGGSWSW